MDKLFYIIYNTYYKKEEHERGVSPTTLFGIFTIAFFCLGLCFLFGAYLVQDPDHFIKHKPTAGTNILVIASAVTTYFMFYHKKRFLVIYDKYKDNPVYKTLPCRILAFTIVFLLIVSPFIMGLVYNKLHTGHWV